MLRDGEFPGAGLAQQVDALLPGSPGAGKVVHLREYVPAADQDAWLPQRVRQGREQGQGVVVRGECAFQSCLAAVEVTAATQCVRLQRPIVEIQRDRQAHRQAGDGLGEFLAVAVAHGQAHQRFGLRGRAVGLAEQLQRPVEEFRRLIELALAPAGVGESVQTARFAIDVINGSEDLKAAGEPFGGEVEVIACRAVRADRGLAVRVGARGAQTPGCLLEGEEDVPVAEIAQHGGFSERVARPAGRRQALGVCLIPVVPMAVEFVEPGGSRGQPPRHLVELQRGRLLDQEMKVDAFDTEPDQWPGNQGGDGVDLVCRRTVRDRVVGRLWPTG